MAILKLHGWHGEAEVLGTLREVAFDADGLHIKGLTLAEANDLIGVLATGKVQATQPGGERTKAERFVLEQTTEDLRDPEGPRNIEVACTKCGTMMVTAETPGATPLAICANCRAPAVSSPEDSVSPGRVRIPTPTAQALLDASPEKPGASADTVPPESVDSADAGTKDDTSSKEEPKAESSHPLIPPSTGTRAARRARAAGADGKVAGSGNGQTETRQERRARMEKSAESKDDGGWPAGDKPEDKPEDEPVVEASSSSTPTNEADVATDEKPPLDGVTPAIVKAAGDGSADPDFLKDAIEGDKMLEAIKGAGRILTVLTIMRDEFGITELQDMVDNCLKYREEVPLLTRGGAKLEERIRRTAVGRMGMEA